MLLKLNENNIEEIINSMTLEEKAKLVVGIGMPGFFGNPPSRVQGAAGETHSIPRLGIPSTVMADGPAGVRIDPVREGSKTTYHATAFPIASLLSSTWNREIVREVGAAMGREAREYGVDFLLAPALNIHRNPLCGRNFEYYSEDPLLSGEMAKAFVEGVQSEGVGACLKHFIANNQETNRLTIDTIVSERALREIYLKGFEIALKAKPWTVMSAYNKLNGTYCSQNKKILTDILRNEWKFDGFVMTDWFAGDDPVEQMKAGNDLIMPGKVNQIRAEREDEVQEIIKAVKEGNLNEEILDRNVRNILKIIVKTLSFRGYKPSNKPDLEEHAKIAYEAAVEGMVLLKNEDGTLPLNKESEVALFGTAQIETIKGGTGSGDTHPRYVVSIVNGLMERGFQIDEDLLKTYKDYIKTMRNKEEYKIREGLFGQPVMPKLPEMDLLKDNMVEEAAERTDVGIIVLGRISGEGCDRKPEKGDFYLSDDEQELIDIVSKAYHVRNKRVVVILNVGGPIEVMSWRDKVDAILLAWQAGQEMGRAVADILSGKVNPSGKLPTTFPKDYWDVPSSKNFPGDPPDDPKKVVYEEGIYVGYRYFDTFDVEPAYEFGYGLSYTTFNYENLKLEKDGSSIRISFDIVNIGEVPGKEVAQVYVRAPKGEMEKPFQELKGFVKTKLLNPGERERITVSVDIASLTYFNEKTNKWVLEEGTYEIRVGASSRDIRLSGFIDVRN